MIEPDQQTTFNPWQYKPWWCQPWTIILTGLSAIAVSWLLFQRLWLTLPLSFVIVIWWLYFLMLWPRLLQQLYREQSGSDHSQST